MDNFDQLKYITEESPKADVLEKPPKTDKQENWRVFIMPILFFSLILVLFLLLPVYPQKVTENTNSHPTATTTKPFPEVKVEAQAFYIFDVNNQVALKSKDETKKLPLASITKIMSSIVAMNEVPALTTINITDEALKVEGNNALRSQEKWTLKDLVKYSLTVSSNNGMNAIATALGAFENERENTTNTATSAEGIFVNLMNNYAKKIGLNDTTFYNETGLDLNTAISGAYSTAKDTAKLLEYAINTQPEIIEATTKDFYQVTSLSNISHLAKNTNEITEKIPGLIGSKTGFTDLAGGNLVVAFDAGLNNPIIISVLGSTKEGRFTDMITLIKATQKYLSN